MFKSTTRTLGVLGGVVALFLIVGGIGISTGMVKLTGSSRSVGADLEAGATVANPADTIPVPAAEAPAPVDTTAPPATTTAAAVVKTPTAKAPKAAPVEEAPVVAAPVVTLPPVTVPALAARTVPSAAQVQSAIQGITGLVQLPLFVQITPANVADVGNRVCTAFDQGQTFSQVKATGLSMVSAYVPVSDAAADYAVRTAVSMYCPGYASKLG
ncbi:MAG: hypothetical protein QOD63_918 [Actinomycetota bacterium]|jgi:hypothetical protein|nr:hypothetical protein [Actinomycetota bacterium]